MRLLIVEDDLDGREMLAELFRMHDWIVTAVPSTHAGMNELRAGGFDVIISDENLDGQSGSSMLREASEEGLLTTVGALMYTAEPGALEVPNGVRVLRKPLAITRLLDEVNALAPEVIDGAPTPSSGARPRKGRVELVLYVTSSASSQRALDSLQQVLAEKHPARVQLVVHDLERDPRQELARHIPFAPMLVKKEQGRELQRFVGDLESRTRLTKIIEELDTFGDCPPSSRAR
jgi:DNA-binding response OmpR family regulator